PRRGDTRPRSGGTVSSLPRDRVVGHAVVRLVEPAGAVRTRALPLEPAVVANGHEVLSSGDVVHRGHLVTEAVVVPVVRALCSHGHVGETVVGNHGHVTTRCSLD